MLHLIFTAFQVQASALQTHALLPAAVLNIVATLAAAYVSILEDQRSLRPSDLLTLYFLVSSLCGLPRLRSLWLLPTASVDVCRYLWLSIFIVTVLVLVVESIPKSRILKPQYQKTSKEQTCGFLNRSFFIWLLPFLQKGYSTALRIEDIDEIDTRLQGQECGERLQAAWKSLQQNDNQRHGVIKATIYAYRWAFLSAVPPRLALSLFNFAQPFLITATINYIGSSSMPETKLTGQALIGAYIIVYVGLAVRTYLEPLTKSYRTDISKDLKGSILAPDSPPAYHDTSRSYINGIFTNSWHDDNCAQRFRSYYTDGHRCGTDRVEFEEHS